jgi:pimeloyl-ACP methyl ester carboxylesterase
MAANAKGFQVRLLPILAFCLAGVGCVQEGAGPAYSGPRPLPEELKAAYSYTRFTGPVTERILKERSTYTKRRISFPSTHNILPGQRDILIDYYDLKGDGKKPVILVLPILGGGNAVEDSFARYFVQHGFSAALVHRQKQNDLVDGLASIDANLRQIVFDHRQAIDWIETRDELDASRIGVFGISMGAIKGALISALDERVGASVLALAGGNIPYLLTYSNEPGIARRRDEYLTEHQLTVEDLQEELTRKITCDPIHFAEYIDAGKVLMVLALFDETVPFEQGRELKEKMGGPETIYLLSGHYTSILFKNYIKYKTRKFFERTLPKRRGGLATQLLRARPQQQHRAATSARLHRRHFGPRGGGRRVIRRVRLDKWVFRRRDRRIRGARESRTSLCGVGPS